MTFAATAAIACAATIAAGWAATQHPELRSQRWLKIGVSLPVALLLVAQWSQLTRIGGIFTILGLGVLGFVWKAPIAHFFTFGVTRLIYGNPNQNTGIRGEFAGPRALLGHGDLDEALRTTLRELEKEPMSYDGLLLLAEVHESLDNPEGANRALETLLRKPGLTPAQRRRVAAERARIGQRLLIAQLNRR